MTYHVYILYSKKLNRFYVGYTNNIQNRLVQHNLGESAYTSQGTPWRLLWSTMKGSARDAVTLESKLKNLSRTRKIKFMRKYSKGMRDSDLLNQLN